LQAIAGYEREMFSAGCTMNIGSKKLQREVGSTFCGAQGKTPNCRSSEKNTVACRRSLEILQIFSFCTPGD
jgi:hypothetical protein